MNKAEIFAWLQKNRKKVVAVGGGVLCCILLLLVALMLSRKGAVDPPAATSAVEPETIYLVLATETASGDVVPGAGRTESFALRPTPTEVMAQVQALAAADLPMPEGKYAGVLVLWPCYFFKITEQKEGLARVVLDGTEDGFGATLVTWLDTARYPEITNLSRGAKLWLAGEISGVDASGTGTITIRADLVSFQDEMPASAPPPPPPPPPAAGAEENKEEKSH